MSNFFPNKAPDLVLVDMINAHFQSNAQRSDFTFGSPIVNDNPFMNTVMSVTVNGGPLFGRLSEIYYNRLNFQQLLTDRNVVLPVGSYANVSDLLPLIQQNYNIVIQPSDIAVSTIEDATTDVGASFIRVRLVAVGSSIAYYGVGDVQVTVNNVANWTMTYNIDNDFAATLFPNWQNAYPMTGIAINGTEQNVPLGRQIQFGIGINYNGTYQIFDIDNQVDLVVDTGENWGVDMILRGIDGLPLDQPLNQFPFIPFVEFRLFNPQPGFENVGPVRFEALPDPTRGNLRTWTRNGSTYVPAYEYNQAGEYISRTRVINEPNQPATVFDSAFGFFDAAIGNDGLTFNDAIFTIEVGMDDLQGNTLFSYNTYLDLRHAGVVAPPSLEGFIFGPVFEDPQPDAMSGSNHHILSLNQGLTQWSQPLVQKQASTYGTAPSSIMFTDPAGTVWQEYENFGYQNMEAYNSAGQVYDHPIFGGGSNPGPAWQSYSDGRTYSGSGNAVNMAIITTPPLIRHPTPIARSGQTEGVVDVVYWIGNSNGAPAFSGDRYQWEENTHWSVGQIFPIALAGRTSTVDKGLIAVVARDTNTVNSANRLIWSTNNGLSWTNIALTNGDINTLSIACSDAEVVWTSGTGNDNMRYATSSNLAVSSPVGGAFQKRRAWWTGTCWLVERLDGTPKIQRYTDLSQAGTLAFTFPVGTTPCGSFLAVGDGKIVVPVLLSDPANSVDFYVSTDDGLTFNVIPGLRLSLGEHTASPGANPGFNIAFTPY